MSPSNVDRGQVELCYCSQWPRHVKEGGHSGARRSSGDTWMRPRSTFEVLSSEAATAPRGSSASARFLTHTHGLCFLAAPLINDLKVTAFPCGVQYVAERHVLPQWPFKAESSLLMCLTRHDLVCSVAQSLANFAPLQTQPCGSKKGPRTVFPTSFLRGCQMAALRPQSNLGYENLRDSKMIGRGHSTFQLLWKLQQINLHFCSINQSPTYTKRAASFLPQLFQM